VLEQDFLDNIVNVQWPPAGYIALGFRVELAPTLEHQKKFFNTHSTDLDEEAFDTPPSYTDPDIWLHFVTQTRFMWSPHRIRVIGDYVAPILGGDGWPEIVDDVSGAAPELARVYNPNTRIWSGTFTPGVNEMTGVPVIHGTITGVASGTIAAAVGSAARGFWPQAEWQDVTGGGTISPPDIGHVIMSPKETGQVDIPFRTVMATTCRGRGVKIEDTGQSSGLPGDNMTSAQGHAAKAFRSLDGDVGVNPGGGPVIAPDRLAATGEFADRSIDFGSMHIVRPTRTWNAIGAAHRAATFTPAQIASNPESRPCGVMWVLMQPVTV